MAELNKDMAPTLHAACVNGAEEIAAALGRALGVELEAAPGSFGDFTLEDLPDDFDGAGLAVLLRFGEAGALLLLPSASGLVPDWCAQPDASGEARLSTLAQELSMLLVPEKLPVSEYRAAWTPNLLDAVKRGDAPSAASSCIPLKLTAGEERAAARFIWPLRKPGAVLEAPAGGEDREPADGTPGASPSPAADESGDEAHDRFAYLPAYARSMLRIGVPVKVNLAAKKLPIAEITELVVGSIIKFEKSCDEPLELNVGDIPLARGEAVKIGDKFGLRINSMILPEERFQRAGERAPKAT